MARKKAQRKQETTLVPHRTPNLGTLLERAKSGSAQAVKAYLDAGGSPVALVNWPEAQHLQLPLLNYTVFRSAHPHRDLAEVIRLLVDAGADINATVIDFEGTSITAVICSTKRQCCSAVLDMLIQAGADPCARSLPGCVTALHYAATNGLPSSCELLLARANELLEARDVDGWTALMRAGSDGRVDTVKLLLQHGADINAANTQDKTALMLASLNDHGQVVAHLLKAGAHVNLACDSGQTALFAAVQCNSSAIVQLLLDHGADISVTDSKGYNVLSKAAHDGHVSMMELLVRCELSVHTVHHSGYTVLMTAVNGGHTAAVEWLLQQGIAVNAVSNEGFTALHYESRTSCNDDTAIIELLLANGADVHKCTNMQCTALDETAFGGNVKCAKVLISAGADVNHINSMHMTSLHIAIKEHCAAVMQLLLEHGATAVMNSVIPLSCTNGAQCCPDVTALMMCTEVDEVKLLLKAGAHVNITNSAGDTCLHVAAKHNWKAPMLCLLIKAGADLHAVNKSGKTAAESAHDKGHTLIEQLLNRAAQQQH
jgi:ankyrin repeat protein